MEKQKKPSRPVVDEYKGVKKENIVVIMTDKNGNKTQIKL